MTLTRTNLMKCRSILYRKERVNKHLQIGLVKMIWGFQDFISIFKAAQFYTYYSLNIVRLLFREQLNCLRFDVGEKEDVGRIDNPSSKTNRQTILKGILRKFISIFISAAKQITSYVKVVGISLSEKSSEHQQKSSNGLLF